MKRTLEVSRKSKIIMQEYAFNNRELKLADHRTIREALSFFSSMIADLENPRENNTEETEMILFWENLLNRYNIELGEMEGVKNALNQLLNEENPPRMLLVKSIETLEKMIVLLRNF